MTLPSPNLDDRSFQDLVDEAKRMVMRLNPDWSDNNVADPGVTLIETFAYMVDQLIFRLNQVPDLNYIRFLDLLGEQLHAPAAAIAPMRFLLTAPQAQDVLVPGGTLIGTTRTSQRGQVVFATESELNIVGVSIGGACTQAAGQQAVSQQLALTQGNEFACFSPKPVVGDTFFVGLTKAAPSCLIRLTTNSRIEGIGVDPLRPPLAIDAWDGQGWSPVRVISDSTGGLNKKGFTDLHIGKHVASIIDGVSAGWIRIQVIEAEEDQPKFTSSPKILSIAATALGGVTNAAQSLPIAGEIVGIVAGTPGEIIQLSRYPLAGGQSNLNLEISSANGWTTWTQVESFAQSTASDQHFTLDDISGGLRFGPMIRQSNGEVRFYGAVPPAGATVRIPLYFVGGGRDGNVDRGTIRVLKTSIPFVSRVENIEPASGGADAETLDNLKARAALTIRSRNRAVTALDFEQLVSAASTSIARTKCLDATTLGKPGVVVVLIIPQVPTGHFPFELLKPQPELLEVVKSYIDERRLLGSTVRIEPPRYLGVSVMVRAALTIGAVAPDVVNSADTAIANFLHPTMGGYEGKGWPFGRQLLAGDIHSVLQKVPGIAYVDVVRLVAVDPVNNKHGEPGDRIQPEPFALLFNVRNQIDLGS